MSEKQDRVLRALETAGISYTLTEHPAVHTIEEMDVLPLPYPEAVLKNLFLQDAGEGTADFAEFEEGFHLFPGQIFLVFLQAAGHMPDRLSVVWFRYLSGFPFL